MEPASVQKQADWLRQEARRHKRASWQHRKKAQECLGRLEELRKRAARLGITITINDTKPNTGGQGDTSSSQQGQEAVR